MSSSKGKERADPEHGPPLSMPPAGSSASPAASFPALLAFLDPALDHIMRAPSNTPDKAPAIDFPYSMGIHTAVYNYFTTQSQLMDQVVDPYPPPRSPAARTQPLSGENLYQHLDAYFRDVAHDLLLGAPHDDTTLIPYLLPAFARFSAGSRSVHRLLNYVNRHYVKRAVDEDKGWLRLDDAVDELVLSLQRTDHDARDRIARVLKDKKLAELQKWGVPDPPTPAQLEDAEASAEAASPPDRVVPLASAGHRRFRTAVLDPLLQIPKPAGARSKKKRPPPKPSGPRGRLARAVKVLLEAEGGDVEERRRLAEGLLKMLKTCGIRPEQPLRKKLEKFLGLENMAGSASSASTSAE